MLDIKFLRQNPDVVKENIKKKFQDEVQKVMNEMKADGTIAKISEKWFGKDITTK